MSDYHLKNVRCDQEELSESQGYDQSDEDFCFGGRFSVRIIHLLFLYN